MSDQSLGTISALVRLRLDQLSRDVAATKVLMSEMSTHAAGETKKVSAASEAASKASLASFANLATQVGTLMAGAGAAVLAGLGAAAKVGADWNQELLHISGNTSMSRKATEEMRHSVESLAGIAAPLDRMAQGYMHVTNFAFNAADATKVLAEATKYAVATGDDASKVSEVLAGTLHNFGMSAEQAGGAMNLLHTAAARANSTLGDFASAAGPAFAAAHSYRISMAEAAAAIQVFTQHQYTASEGTTLFANLVEHVANPTRITKKALADLGLQHSALAKDMSYTGLSARTIVGFLTDLDAAAKKTGKSAEELSHQLFRGRMGGTGTAVLVQNLREYAKAAKELQEIFDKGAAGIWQFEAANTSLAGQIQIVKNNFTILAGKIEQDLLPLLNGVLTHVRDLVKWFEELPDPVRRATVEFAAFAGAALLAGGGLSLLVGWAIKLAAAFTAALPIMGVIGTALLPFVPEIAAIVAALALLAAAWANDWGGMREQTAEFVTWIKPYLRDTWTEIVETAKSTLGELQRFWHDLWGDMRDETRQSTEKIGGHLSLLESIWGGIWSTLVTIVKVAWSLIKGIVQTGVTIIEGILVIGERITRFDWAGAWDAMSKYVSRTFDSIIGTVSSSVDILIGEIRRFFGFVDQAASVAHLGFEPQGHSHGTLHTTAELNALVKQEGGAGRPHVSHSGGGSGGGKGGGGALDDMKQKAEELRKRIEEVRDSIFKLTHDEFQGRQKDVLKELNENIKAGVPAMLAQNEAVLKMGKIASDHAKKIREDLTKVAPVVSLAASALSGMETMIRGAVMRSRELAEAMTKIAPLAATASQALNGISTAFNGAVLEAKRQAASKGLSELLGGNNLGGMIASAGDMVAKARAVGEEMARIRYEVNNADYKDYLKLLLDKIKATTIYTEEWKRLNAQIGDVLDKTAKRPVEATQREFSRWQNVLKSMADQMTSVFEGAFKNLFEHGWKSFFGDILKGFTQMLEQMLAQLLAKAVIFGILSMFGGGLPGAKSFGSFLGFDNWGNDRVAQHWGFDYADHFTRGMQQFSARNRTDGSNRTNGAVTVHAPVTVHATINREMDIREVSRKIAWEIGQSLPGYVT